MIVSRVWLIARREYVERIRTRGFLITTIMIPVIMAGFTFGSVFLGSRVNTDQHIAVVSTDTQLILDLQTELNRRQNQQRQQDAAEVPSTPQPGTQPGTPPASPLQPHSNLLVEAIAPGPDTRADLDRQLDANELDGYLWITPAPTPDARPTFEFTPRSSREASIRNPLAAALGAVLMREQLNHRGIVAAEADSVLLPVQIVTAHGPHHHDRESAQISVLVLFFIMYLVIMLYGMNVARSIIEEKTSRIFEVLLATVRPEALMAGKILGVGAVGLTQVGIWLGALLTVALSAAALHTGGSVHLALTLGQVVFFLVYFVLGYLFYSAIAAALGAMTNSEQELQQLNMFLMLPLLVCFSMLGTLLNAPDGSLARILALIPPFTPLLMYMRISLGHPAAWEVALSLVLLSASILAIIWVTSRIYRVGVLMYGKRPNLPELLRWLRYS